MGAPDDARRVTPGTAAQRWQGADIVRLPASRLAIDSAAFHREELADCIHMALACLFCTAVTLAACAGFREASIQGQFARILRAGLGFLAAASAAATLLAVGLALVHFIQLRQVDGT